MVESIIIKKLSLPKIRFSGICSALPVTGLFLLSLLSGCASMNNQFDCPMKSGIRCESLDSVNARIDRGELRGEIQDDNSHWQTTSLETVALANTEQKSTTGPHRHPETVQRVWIAPFEDSQGNYHESGSVYAVMNPGRWDGSHQAGNSGGSSHA